MILHLVTDRRRLSSTVTPAAAFDCLLRQVGLAVDAGVDVIQIRERDLEAGALAELTVAVMRLSRGGRTRVVVNDRLDVALATGADGVHLPARGLPVTAVRRAAPAGFLIGRSVHDARELADAAGADYVIAGTVWPTRSKPDGHAPIGDDGLMALVRSTPIPVLAVGGVTLGRAADVARAGAAGIAAISLFMSDTYDAGCGAVSLAAVVDSARQLFDTRSGSSRSAD